MKNIKLVVLFLLISLFSFSNFCSGIGMVTQPIVLENVLRGQELKQILTLVNSEESLITYNISTEGNIENWISFYEKEDLQNSITEISIPARQHAGVIVKINIPKDSPNGEYEGKIVITTKPQEKEKTESGVVLALRVERDISVNITDNEIVKFSTAIIPLKYSVKKGDPLQIKLIYTNEGNVSVKPDVEMKVKKDSKTVFNVIYPYPEEEPVRPFEQKELNYIKWTTAGQKKGEYIIETNIKLEDKLIKEHSFSFNIGRDASYYLGALAGLGSGRLGIILISIGILLIGIFLIRTFVFKKRDWMLLAGFVKSIFF